MQKEKAWLIIHPKAEHFVTDILAVLEQRWETTAVVTRYAGHGMEIAARVCEQNAGLVIAYGGDGMLNEIVNGVMRAQMPCLVAPLPGGTVNQWAHEIGLPADPVEAARALITSTSRSIDIGSIELQAYELPDEPVQLIRGERKPTARDHFLLVAGLGLDAATIRSTSEVAKERYGQFAFILDWFRILPELRPFPIQITWSSGQSYEAQAWEVLVSNTRRYTRVENLIVDAHVDDGLLDIRLFSLSSLGHLLFHPYQDVAFSLRLPASVALEIDGSSVQLADYMSQESWKHIQSAPDASKVMLTYQFIVKPSALSVAIPQGYKGELFKNIE